MLEVHLFCNIAQVQVDLFAFYPENGHFCPKTTKRWNFWEMNIFIFYVDICTHAFGVPSLLEYSNSIKLVVDEIISWLIILKMDIFWLKIAKIAEKLHHLVKNYCCMLTYETMILL